MAPAPAPGAPVDDGPLPGTITRAKSQWVPVRWSELPGWGADALHEAWNAWLRSCERPAPTVGALCTEVRRLSIASAAEQQAFVQSRLQPYRVQATFGGGPAAGQTFPITMPMMVLPRWRASAGRREGKLIVRDILGNYILSGAETPISARPLRRT